MESRPNRNESVTPEYSGADLDSLAPNPSEATRELRKILEQQPESLEVTIVRGGHMAYDYAHVSDGLNQLFIKSHNPRHFTDTRREDCYFQ